jgi:hypothetical protein
MHFEQRLHKDLKSQMLRYFQYHNTTISLLLLDIVKVVINEICKTVNVLGYIITGLLDCNALKLIVSTQILFIPCLHI